MTEYMSPPTPSLPCERCDHPKWHHGHYDGKRGEWVDDGRCFVQVAKARRKTATEFCRCKGYGPRDWTEVAGGGSEPLPPDPLRDCFDDGHDWDDGVCQRCDAMLVKNLGKYGEVWE